MLKGINLLGFTESNRGNVVMQAFSPLKQAMLPEHFVAASNEEVNEAVVKAVAADDEII